MMRTQIPEVIAVALPRRMADVFRDNFKSLILYGSWARGTAREDSDIDLLAIFQDVDKDTRRRVDEIVSERGSGLMITIVCSSVDSFRKEELPLHTAIKREGSILWGNVDFAISSEAPEVKYAEFFKKSREFESEKIETAEYLLSKGMGSGVADYCFIAAKHAIQAALAMHGEGYTSKMKVLLPLAEKRFGRGIADALERLFRLYVKTEYMPERLDDDEAKIAVELAKRVLMVYE